MSATTEPCQRAGNFAPAKQTEDAGSEGRQVREDLILTRITKTKLQKESPVEYFYPIPDVYIFMTINLLQYTLNVTESVIDADGVLMPYGKVFNNIYPGPWIRRFFNPTILLLWADLFFF